MELRLKIRAAFVAVVVIALGVLFFLKLDFEIACWAMLGAIALAALYMWHQKKRVEQRQEWLNTPIPPHVNEFDSFFWGLTINQQNWYLSNIYSKEDVISLIKQYEEKVKELWRDSTDDLYDKISDAQNIEGKLLTLMYFADFFGDVEGDAEDID